LTYEEERYEAGWVTILLFTYNRTMPTFTITPNLRTLNRYLTSATDAHWKAEQPDYVPEPIINVLEWEIFNDEAAFEKSFKELLTKYNLIDHYNNLLYLTLYIYDQVWQSIQIAYDDYSSKKRTRELAQLLLMLKGTKKGKLDQIMFKSLTDTAKTTDSLLNDWISGTLIEALEQKKFPIGGFGATVLEMLSDEEHPLKPDTVNEAKLQQYAKMRLIHPKNRINKAKVSISLLVYSYLEGETQLKAEGEASFSDVQLNFFFELLELLKQVDRNNMKSLPKDYMRTLIFNVVKDKVIIKRK